LIWWQITSRHVLTVAGSVTVTNEIVIARVRIRMRN
jgi:hypothetical protein